MTYQVIARKWRPQTFEEVTGQETITRTLRNAVEHDRLHHAYIFSGARGVGKTTTARLLAKALNCHKTDKPNPNPCAIDDPTACASCREIAESRSIDVLEFDAASHTGVDDIREIILESININPARDRYKVFIIDEVHMLSNSSFNALLKTLEEPPPRVEFIMATTELHKLPDTILSRCQEFEFRTIPLQKIFDRIKLIAEAEKINVSDEALKEIARAGQGSMRDAQSSFDQVISFSGEQIGVSDVGVALGIASAEMLVRTVNAIAENKPGEALKVIDDLIARGQDLRNFSRDLLAFFRDLLVFKIAGDSENLLDTAILSREELHSNSAPFSESDLIRFFNSLGETETKLREATQPRYVLEIGLVKLIEMRRVAPIEKILERLAKLESAFSGGNYPAETKTETSKSAPINLSDFAAPTPEKKTLTIDFSSEEVPFAVGQARISNFTVQNSPPIESKIEIQPAEEPEIASPNFNFQIEEPPGIFPETESNLFVPVNSFEAKPIPEQISWATKLAAMPVKMPQISAEELEHIEDVWLDTDFERKLLDAGENLSPIKNIAQMVEILLAGINGQNPDTAKTEASNGEASLAKEQYSFAMSAFEEEPISDEIPVLPENPTEEQLWHYAENHPLAKKVLRIFRGKIIEVRRTSQAS